MITYYKDILGLLASDTSYDVYLVIICGITISWIVKCVIVGLYSSIINLFR